MADEIKTDRRPVDQPPVKREFEQRRGVELAPEATAGTAGAEGLCRTFRTAHTGWCDNGEWFSRGVVTRDKATKEIVDREKK